ncbi:hypothetical protein CDD83_11240 [Cordyceps sp. RAO-2017]|nr:hypothetical protein CDD83_11240 [Cordyceps sp. RAO-2017]
MQARRNGRGLIRYRILQRAGIGAWCTAPPATRSPGGTGQWARGGGARVATLDGTVLLYCTACTAKVRAATSRRSVRRAGTVVSPDADTVRTRRTGDARTVRGRGAHRQSLSLRQATPPRASPTLNCYAVRQKLGHVLVSSPAYLPCLPFPFTPDSPREGGAEKKGQSKTSNSTTRPLLRLYITSQSSSPSSAAVVVLRRADCSIVPPARDPLHLQLTPTTLHPRPALSLQSCRVVSCRVASCRRVPLASSGQRQSPSLHPASPPAPPALARLSTARTQPDEPSTTDRRPTESHGRLFSTGNPRNSRQPAYLAFAPNSLAALSPTLRPPTTAVQYRAPYHINASIHHQDYLLALPDLPQHN